MTAEPVTAAPVLLEIADRVATITLNRPEVRNAMSSEVLRLLPALVTKADGDPEVDVIILTGADPAFCAGLDLKELGSRDSQPLGAFTDADMMAAIRGFDLIDEHLPGLKRTYAERRQVAVAGLRELGLEVFPPGGTFYVWARVPGDLRSVEFCARVLDSSGVVTTPGVGFGRNGEGYFRLALCSEVAAVKKAMALLAEAGLWAARSGS